MKVELILSYLDTCTVSRPLSLVSPDTNIIDCKPTIPDIEQNLRDVSGAQ